MEKIMPIITNSKLYASIVILVFSVLIYKILKRGINRILEKDKEKGRIDSKGKTIFKLFSNVLKYVMGIIALVLILQVYGVNVSSLVAGLGLLSVIAGLAIQDPLKDIVSGMNLVADEYYALGDYVRIDEIEGKVIQLGVRTTKIQSMVNGEIYEVANRNISKAVLLSNQLYIYVPISYEDNIEKIEEILEVCAGKISQADYITKCEYMGVSKFEDSCIKYMIQIILASPADKFKAQRLANKIIKLELDRNKVSIPYPQIDIHNK